MIFESFATFMNKILLFSGFVASSTGFEKPLTIEEEKYYFKKYKEENDLKAKEILINHNLRLVAHIVKKYNMCGEADDLISVGSIGLIKAIESYEENKGSQLSTYASRCIENEILMLLRVNKKHKYVMSIQDSLGQDKDGNDVELSDIIAETSESVIDQVDNNILNEKLASLIKEILPKREYEIIKLRYGLEGGYIYTQREVAKKLGISRSYISRLETKSFETIRQEVKKRNIFL